MERTKVQKVARCVCNRNESRAQAAGSNLTSSDMFRKPLVFVVLSQNSYPFITLWASRLSSDLIIPPKHLDVGLASRL